jgi:pSer/pThr/pTyr-binding forkhead associated (FHA) protein
VITLTLLHPLQPLPVQSWTFHHESSIKIGRATNNEVVLYSAVVSRHHVELKKLGVREWEVINLGSNGTYIDDEPIERAKITNGTIVRLSSSGPKILVKIESNSNHLQSDSSEHLIAKRQPKTAKDTLIN